MKTLALALLWCACASAQPAYPGANALDAAIEEAIREGRIPGAVLRIGQPGKVLYEKAYGNRAIVPAREAMTLDTIFDAASLTKPIATGTSIMKLLEQGKVRLTDRVTEYLPTFQGGKSAITVRQLLTHFSGLRPDLDLEPAWSGYELGIRKALADKPVAAPGERFIYSDINFELLGEIVRVVSGKPLNEFVRDEVFQPLGMRETTFLPPAAWRPRIAPTEAINGAPLRGVVHDPTARFMGGVAGHAGLFTTAADLARYAEMMLGLGARENVRILSPLTAKKFTESNTPPHQPVQRGLGWDIESPFSTNRGELFPVGSYGHTGFTGTSLWIDPSTKTYVILLTNSVHPTRRPAITSLRARIATVAAAATGAEAPGGALLTGFVESNPEGVRRSVSRNAQVLTGLDVLAQQKFAPLMGKRVGLITNHTGLTRDGQRGIDVMLAAGVNLTALFTQEHGITGKLDIEMVEHSKDAKSGLPIWSLYRGEDRRPRPEMLRGLDVLVFDIQDIGARYYTYISTMKNVMEAAAQARMTFMVLDRPNPIGGLKVEGPMLEPGLISFIGCFPMPLRHGMTVGEIAKMLNAEAKINARLEVVAMKGWNRGDAWDSTNLRWVDPSPNMRSWNAALLYPAIAWLESSRNYSVGRGTDAPFEQIGADWIDGPALADALNRRFLPGVRVYPTQFTPTASYFKDKTIDGLRFVITDRDSFSTFRLGLELSSALERLYPGKIPWETNARLIGDRKIIERIKKGDDPRTIELDTLPAIWNFQGLRNKYLIY